LTSSEHMISAREFMMDAVRADKRF
jgi:hypothetical protein